MSCPNWYNGKSINEVEFCTEFVKNRPLKCICGKLYGIDGEISDSEICHDISVMLTEFVTTGISRKVKSLLEALKLFCHSEPIPVCENEIHLLNGILKTDGTWISEKRFCVNRLNVFYRPEIQNGNCYPNNSALSIDMTQKGNFVNRYGIIKVEVLWSGAKRNGKGLQLSALAKSFSCSN